MYVTELPWPKWHEQGLEEQMSCNEKKKGLFENWAARVILAQ